MSLPRFFCFRCNEEIHDLRTELRGDSLVVSATHHNRVASRLVTPESRRRGGFIWLFVTDREVADATREFDN